MGAKLKIILFLTLTTPTTVNANLPQSYKSGVNIKDASYFIVANDSPKYAILSRNYSSRSLHNGYYGFGWCSPLETQLQLQSGIYKLKKCGLEYKVTTAEFKDLKFNSSGNLIQIIDGQKNYNLFYHLNNLQRIELDGTIIARFTFNLKNSKIMTIQYADGLKTQFYYQSDNLMWTKTEQRGAHLFDYDFLHNLTNWKSSLGYGETLKYDRVLDHLIERRTDNCAERYSYSAQADALTVKVQVQKECRKQKSSEVGYTFNFIRNPTGERSLETMRMHTDRGEFLVQYNPSNGKTLKIGRVSDKKNLDGRKSHSQFSER